jgi:hypothetical protein
VRREERLGAATVIAIVALWFHVALSLVMAMVSYEVPRGGSGLALLSLVWAAACAAVQSACSVAILWRGHGASPCRRSPTW